MPLDIHSSCKQRLIEILSTQLPKVKVDAGMFLDFTSAKGIVIADESLPDPSPLRAELVSYISELPVFYFVTSSLSRQLGHAEHYQRDAATVLLFETTSFKGKHDLAEQLVDDFCSLPWSYKLTIQLPSELSEQIAKYTTSSQLGSEVELVQATAQFQRKYPKETDHTAPKQGLLGLTIFSPDESDTWPKSAMYLQLSTLGFIPDVGDCNTFESAENHLKSIFGLMLALSVVEVSHVRTGTSSRISCFLHKDAGGSWETAGIKKLDASTSNLIERLQLPHENTELDGDTKKKWLNLSLKRVGSILESPDKSARILLASQWLFESLAGENKLLAFVQATIVLEILLGDKAESDQVGLSVLLRNRCAYLICNSLEQRNEVMKDFKKIYAFRSKIVHAGTNKLTSTESVLLSKLQWMCHRVINEEAKLLEKDLARP